MLLVRLFRSLDPLVGSDPKKRHDWLRSHNKALFKGWKEGVYGKTGYTNAARACFIGHVHKGKEDLIIGVFGCPGNTRWNDIKHIVEKYGGVDL